MGLRAHKVLIYQLKRQFGQAATYIVPDSTTHNITTGAIIRAFTKHEVKRAVLMPAELTRSFVYDLAYIASAKNFTHGGFFDVTSRIILIDAKDLPKGFEAKVNHHIEFGTLRFEIKTILDQPPNAFFAFVVQALSNAPVVGP